MRFLPVKSEDQQARLMVHRARQGFVVARMACINRIRGLMSEFGIGQYSSGGQPGLGRINHAGDAYLRSLLLMGARAVPNAAKGKSDSLSRWAVALEQRRGYWKAVVAIAANNARMAWAARCGPRVSRSNGRPETCGNEDPHATHPTGLHPASRCQAHHGGVLFDWQSVVLIADAINSGSLRLDRARP